jgi:hypothetical protein
MPIGRVGMRGSIPSPVQTGVAIGDHGESERRCYAIRVELK